MRIWPAREVSLDSDSEGDIHGAVVFAKERSFQQDFAFGLRQLSDIALKGLSPGVNDPTTAMQAMDRMEAIFVALGSKALPSTRQEREVGGNRVLAAIGYYDFEDVVGLAFDQIRRAAFTSGQVAVLERLLEILERAIQVNTLPDRRRTLWARAVTVARLAPEQIPAPEDTARLVRRAGKIGTYLVRTGLREEVDADLEDLAARSKGFQRSTRPERDASLDGPD